eukprot:scaffold35095_cov70-Phaeocystis_antarctica.AAC.1
MFFEKKCNRVARSGAAWDPIALLAKEHIGITTGRTHRRKKSAGAQMLLPERGRATARAARNGRHAS